MVNVNLLFTKKGIKTVKKTMFKKEKHIINNLLDNHIISFETYIIILEKLFVKYLVK